MKKGRLIVFLDKPSMDECLSVREKLREAWGHDTEIVVIGGTGCAVWHD